MAIKATLCSLDALKTYLDITENTKDTMLTQLLEYATERFQTLTHRVIPKTKHEDEKHDGTEQQWFYVDNYPIIGITSIYWDSDGDYETEDLVESDNYRYDANSGKVWRTAGTWAKGLNAIKITYTAGYETIPKDVETFVKKLAALEYKRSDQDRIGVLSHSFGDATTSYDTQNLPDDLGAIVEDYRRPV